MRFIQTIICVATLSSAAFGGRVSAGENDSEFDDIAWETTTGQDEFDEVPLLPENSDVPPPPPPPPPVIPVTPAVVKIEQIYSVPHAQSVEKEKDKPGEKYDLLDHATDVSLVSGGTLLWLAVLATVATAAGEALLLASGAIVIACLSGGAWTWPGGTRESPDSAAVYGVVAAETRALLREPYGDGRGGPFFGHGRRRHGERSTRKS